MAIDEITSTQSILLKSLQSRDRTILPLDTNVPSNAVNSLTAALEATQALTPAQQAALVVNETLQSLNFEPSSPVDALLLNETNPSTIVAVGDIALSPTQQAALAFNESLQTLATAPVTPETTVSALATEIAAQGLTVGALDTTLATAASAGVTTGVETPAVNVAAQAASATSATTPSATETIVAPLAPNAIPPAVPLVLDRNPIAVGVYEIRDQTPAPPEPKPLRREVVRPVPLGRVRPVDRLVLRREWEKRKENQRREELLPRPPLAERSILQMVSQVNEDLAANGLPFRLVLANNNGEYSLDIYDCSDDTLCRLAQEVPLDLKELLTTLDNLQHETGIIINIKT